MTVSGTVARIVGRHVYLQDKAGGFYIPYGTKITVGGRHGKKGRLTDVAPGDSAELAVKKGSPAKTVSNTARHGDEVSVVVDSANFVKNGLKG